MGPVVRITGLLHTENPRGRHVCKHHHAPRADVAWRRFVASVEIRDYHHAVLFAAPPSLPHAPGKEALGKPAAFALDWVLAVYGLLRGELRLRRVLVPWVLLMMLRHGLLLLALLVVLSELKFEVRWEVLQEVLLPLLLFSRYKLP